MTRKLRGIYGVGGHGRETMLFAPGRGAGDVEYVFVDDGAVSRTINGHRVLTYPEFLSAPIPDKRINIAIGDSRTRQRLVQRCTDDRLAFFSVVATNAVVGADVTLGDGCIVSPFCLITTNVSIGAHVHFNMHSYVAHDCHVGDFVTFGPAVCCNGNVVVGRHAYIGAGAMIRQGTRDCPTVIGDSAVVGMGAVVLHSVSDGTTVVGNPARPIASDHTESPC